MTDASLQRLNMVESQVRPSDVTDRRIIRAMGTVPREAFVPEALKPVAYMDEAVPLERRHAGRSGRELMAPRTFAKLLQLAAVEADATVLDVGCTTGYSTAVIASLARRVIGLEPDAGLAATATRTLAELGVKNAAVVGGPVADGRRDDGPYDAIVLEGAVPDVPASLLDQLKDGGRLVAVMVGGASGAGKAVVWTRTGRTYDSREAFDAAAALLPGLESKAPFVL